MKLPHIRVIALLSLLLTGWNSTYAQSGPEFINCTDTVATLSILDDGVYLPASNALFLGDEHPDATRCSVHLTRSKTFAGGCGQFLQYKIEILLGDTLPAILLQPLTTIAKDTTGQTEIVLQSENSLDSIIRHQGLSYTQGCQDYHKIQWTVIDSCGQVDICFDRLRLVDRSSPLVNDSTILFIYQLTSSCQVSLHAKDYYTSPGDDCLVKDELLFSLDSAEHVPSLFTYCDFIPAFGVALPWSVWVADQGVDQNCDGEISWAERNRTEQIFSLVFVDYGSCDCWKPGNDFLAGNIYTEYYDYISGVEVSLHQPGHVYPTFVTGNDGGYRFNNLFPGEYEISAQKNIFHKNGVTTLDLVKIQKHLLGKEYLESPYEVIAADANNSQHVSAIDLVELRKLVLGIYSQFPNNESWKFVRADYIFQDTLDPWPMDDPGIITVTDLENPGNLDFIGIKIGDVNHTANPLNTTSVLPRSTPKFKWMTIDQQARAGQSLMVPFTLAEAESMEGFQFTVEFPGFEFVGIHSGVIDLEDDDYALFDEQLTMSWFEDGLINIEANQPLFYLELKAIHAATISKSLEISSAITEAEMYIGDEEIVKPVLQISNGHDAASSLFVSCQPNPWKDHTEVSIHLDSDELVNMVLYSSSGKQLWSADIQMTKGSHQVQLNASDFSARGQMILQISTSKDRVFQKMILLD